jgi:hypothetical protein
MNPAPSTGFATANQERANERAVSSEQAREVSVVPTPTILLFQDHPMDDGAAEDCWTIEVGIDVMFGEFEIRAGDAEFGSHVES